MSKSATYTYARKIQAMVHEVGIDIVIVKMKKTPEWVRQRLSIARLHHSAGEMVDKGEISITNALILADFTPIQQLYLQNDAKSMSAEDFTNRVHRFKEWIIENKDSDGKVPMENQGVNRDTESVS